MATFYVPPENTERTMVEVDDETFSYLKKKPYGFISFFLLRSIEEKLAREPQPTVEASSARYPFGVATWIGEAARQRLNEIPPGLQSAFIRDAIVEKLAREPVPSPPAEDKVRFKRRIETHLTPEMKQKLLTSLPPSRVSAWLRQAIAEKIETYEDEEYDDED